MKYRLHSEHIRQRLLWSMAIIIVCFAFISLPLIVNSYQVYKKTQRALKEVFVLQDIVTLANKVSRERAPSNKVMASSPEELERNLVELYEFRGGVDQQLEHTVAIMKKNGFSELAETLSKNLNQTLSIGRSAVDEYVKTPTDLRTADQLNRAIKKMFVAWDSTHDILKNVVLHSLGKDSVISDNYTIILLLSDLRDQAGRVASNVMAAVTFGQPISDESMANSFQTQYQSQYLWDLINTLQPKELRTKEYLELHKKVQTEFLNKGIPTVASLIRESRDKVPYSLKGTELTEVMVDKFVTVVDLQTHLLKASLESVEREHFQAFRKFLYTLVLSSISFLTAIFTLVYARKSIFTPLIEARQKILDLSQSKNSQNESNKEAMSLFEAIQKLQVMLQQRDLLEFQLTNIANTDTLTGVSNRLALNKYISLLEQRPEKLTKTGLIILDIDDFKLVNDRLGHIVGDKAIQFVANKLKDNVRSSDLIVRYGGDEFLIIIDSVEPIDILLMAEKIRQIIDQSEFYIPEINDFLKLTVSIGVAVGAPSWMMLLESADKSLFRVKASGKNAVSG